MAKVSVFRSAITGEQKEDGCSLNHVYLFLVVLSLAVGLSAPLFRFGVLRDMSRAVCLRTTPQGMVEACAPTRLPQVTTLMTFMTTTPLIGCCIIL